MLRAPLIILLVASSVGAEPAAPLPGDESGRIDRPRGEPTWRKVGRGVLFVPRVALDLAFTPVLEAAYLYERYRIGERWMQLFFDDTRTYGAYPIFKLDSQYGFTGGARFVHRDLFGKREHLSAHALVGGGYSSRYDLRVRTGERLGERLLVEARGEVERRPHDAYYGIGNHDNALETRHRQELERAWLQTDLRVTDLLHVRAAGALTDLDYGPGDRGLSIEMGYDPSALTGFMGGVRHAYGELELRIDTRRRASEWDVKVIPATGWLVAAHAGRVHQLAGTTDDYWRTGFELQRYISLGRGPRVLSARLRTEAVTGSYDDVAFTELPQLGGPRLLRGYPLDRFRDRASALAGVEYLWDLNRNLCMSLFVDGGQVFPSPTDLQLDDVRVGYGVGLQAVTTDDFIAEMTIASSIDGGLFLNLAFDPIHTVEPRVVQR